MLRNWSKNPILRIQNVINKNSVIISNQNVRYLFKKKETELPKDSDRFDRTSKGNINTKDLILSEELFRNIKNHERQSFLDLVDNFSKRSQHKTRLGQCEFIYAGLKVLKDFNLNKDVEAYKKLLNVMPKEKMKPQNVFQEIGVYYAKHQYTATHLLDYMEQNKVVPDKEMQDLVINIFGERSMVFRKLARMNYWMSKLKNISPFPLPEKLPIDPKELAKIALKKMCPDCQTKIQFYNTEIIKDCLDKTWIAIAQSQSQKEIIKNLNQTIYVEGPYLVYLQDVSLSYFVLKTDPPQTLYTEKDTNPFDVSNLKYTIYGGVSKSKVLQEIHKIHKQEDGSVLAICCTGTSSRDSLLSWIRIMEKLDNNLSKLQVVFRLKAPPEPQIVTLNENVSNLSN